MDEVEHRRLRMHLLRELYFAMTEDCGTNATEYFMDFYERIVDELHPSFKSLSKHFLRCPVCKKMYCRLNNLKSKTCSTKCGCQLRRSNHGSDISKM